MENLSTLVVALFFPYMAFASSLKKQIVVNRYLVWGSKTFVEDLAPVLENGDSLAYLKKNCSEFDLQSYYLYLDYYF
jgi:hypothetical protein